MLLRLDYDCDPLDLDCLQKRNYHVKKAILDKFLALGKSKWWGLNLGKEVYRKICLFIADTAKLLKGSVPLLGKVFKENCN